ncbi:BRO family protein [uncultured Tolumonas sp.]|uniref:BRO-N domain-containing protein n=1 Tax=uncultured Tolumonas sp. TaxID=263765 RepID=UPI002A0A5767|nr:BRO family protein [uncultured Tolumonas sp.]
MNAQLQQFSFEEDEMLADVRIHIGDNGEPWFVAKDVAVALGYSNTTDAINKHCKGAVEITAPTTGGLQKLKFINEPDVYRLVMRSKLPSAEKFQDWVYNIVLPSIRKHGYFQLRDMSAPVRQVIDLQNQALKLTDRMEKISNPSMRESVYTMLTGIYALMQIAIPPLDAFDKPPALPTEHHLVAKFFDRVAMFEAQGYQLNHSRNQYVAINMNEFINLCAEEKLPTIASNEWKEALRTSKRFVGIRTVNSGIKSQAVRCWLFTAEVSA